MKWLVILTFLGQAWINALCCCSFAAPTKTAPSCHATVSCHKTESNTKDRILKVCDCEGIAQEAPSAVSTHPSEPQIPEYTPIPVPNETEIKAHALSSLSVRELSGGHGPPPSPPILSRFII